MRTPGRLPTIFDRGLLRACGVQLEIALRLAADERAEALVRLSPLV